MKESMDKPQPEISRRALLEGLGAAAAAGALAGRGAPAPAQPMPRAGGDAPRTIALIGDRWHYSDYIRVALDRLFRQLGLPIEYTTNYQDLSAEFLQPFQLFIFLRDNMIWPDGYLGPNLYPYESSLENAAQFPAPRPVYWITESQGEAVKNFVAAGGGLYSLHNNAYVSRSSKSFREVQGGVALGHPPLRPFKVCVVNHDHPVARGVRDFMVEDEQHFEIYDKDPRGVLLHGENLDGLAFETSEPAAGGEGRAAAPRALGTTSICGWAHEYGKGRVVFTAMGHTIPALWQPEYFKLQQNAVRWLLRREERGEEA